MSSQFSEHAGPQPGEPTPSGGGTDRSRASAPEPVRALVRDCIPSHEALECLVLLAQQRHPLAASTICARVDFPRLRTEAALRALDEAGLVLSSTGRTDTLYCYAPADDRRSAAEMLLEQYRRNLVGIVKLITANSLERMHSHTSDMLADAVLVERSSGSERSHGRWTGALPPPPIGFPPRAGDGTARGQRRKGTT